MRKGIVWYGLAAVSLVLGAATASADDFRGFYAGAGIGSNSIDIDGVIDDSDTGFKAFVGYSLGEFLAVELAYIDGGEAEDTQDFSDDVGPGTDLRTKVETKTVNLSVIGNLQLTDSFALIGRLGYASIDQDADVRLRFLGTEIDSFSGSDTEEEISYGVGAVFTIRETFQLRAEYEAFDVADGDLSFVSLNAAFRFR
jgi:hypothetical protein